MSDTLQGEKAAVAQPRSSQTAGAQKIFLASHHNQYNIIHSTYCFFFPPFFPFDKRLFFPTAMTNQPTQKSSISDYPEQIQLLNA